MPPAPSVLWILYRPPRTVPTEAFSAPPPPTVCSLKRIIYPSWLTKHALSPRTLKIPNIMQHAKILPHIWCASGTNILRRRIDFRSCGLLPSGLILGLNGPPERFYVFLPSCHKDTLTTSEGVLMPYVMIGDEPVPVVIVPDLGDSAARLGSGGDQV